MPARLKYRKVPARLKIQKGVCVVKNQKDNCEVKNQMFACKVKNLKGACEVKNQKGAWKVKNQKVSCKVKTEKGVRLVKNQKVRWARLKIWAIYSNWLEIPQGTKIMQEKQNSKTTNWNTAQNVIVVIDPCNTIYSEELCRFCNQNM